MDTSSIITTSVSKGLVSRQKRKPPASKPTQQTMQCLSLLPGSFIHALGSPVGRCRQQRTQSCTTEHFQQRLRSGFARSGAAGNYQHAVLRSVPPASAQVPTNAILLLHSESQPLSGRFFGLQHPIVFQPQCAPHNKIELGAPQIRFPSQIMLSSVSEPVKCRTVS